MLSCIQDNAWSYCGKFRSTCEERLRLANQWFQQCTTSHTCRPSNTVFTPRRLIHIGDTNQRLRLIETTSGFLDTGLQYVALSYCWGPGGGTLTTTLDNIEAHKSDIPFYRLPSVRRSLSIYNLLLILTILLDHKRRCLCLSEVEHQLSMG
jgi:hypothetical protein